MSTTRADCIVYPPEALLPAAWREFPAAGPMRMFNPGLLREGSGWIFAYRVVGPDARRRIALCRLDGGLRVVADSAVPWSDCVQFRAGHPYPEIATRWFADPRLYRLANRLFITWNSGWHEPQNHQFVQELDAATLRPAGPPRELLLSGPRQKLEKNWTLFGGDGGRVRAIYSIQPHRVLEFSLAGDGDIAFDEVASTDWVAAAYPKNHGGLRGGAPPFFAGGHYWSFCHSVHDGPAGYRYAAAVYRFAASHPFAPTDAPVAPLDLAASLRGHRAHPRLNPAVAEVIYPCGAARADGRWLISHGINDESAAISIVAESDVMAAMAPLR